LLLSFFFLLALAWTLNGLVTRSKKGSIVLLVFAVIVPLMEAFVSVYETALLALLTYGDPKIGLLNSLCGITEFPADFVVGYNGGIIGPDYDDYIMGFRIGNLTFAFPFEFLPGEFGYMLTRLTIGLTIMPFFFILNLIGSVFGLALQPSLAKLWGLLKIRVLTERHQLLHFLVLLGTTAVIIVILNASVVLWAYWYHYPFSIFDFP